MPAPKRRGRQTPTKSVVLKYDKTLGQEAIDLYNTARTACEWQELLVKDIMAVNTEGLWVHQIFGYSVPRRNGKNEIAAMRELWGLKHGEHICHTAHRTTTSHAAYERLCKILTEAGYIELGRKSADTQDPANGYRTKNQYGLESITMAKTGGSIVFRTRTAAGGLGEGFDLLVIDEAQEYTMEQQAALIYTVTDSKNPQTIYCGTPPTPQSTGTVFTKLRNNTLDGGEYDTGWAEWSIDDEPNELDDVESWYETNPSMGYHLDERKIRTELGTDRLDFIIQRLGYWYQYNLQSAITRDVWQALQVKTQPKLTGQLYVGVKFDYNGKDAAVAIAAKTVDDKYFVEVLDCRPVQGGIDWIVNTIKGLDVARIVVDGKSREAILTKLLKQEHLKKPTIPTTEQIIEANANFEQLLYAGSICHTGQASLEECVANTKRRAIRSNGGFGYSSLKADISICLLDSVILALWGCKTLKRSKGAQLFL